MNTIKNALVPDFAMIDGVIFMLLGTCNRIFASDITDDEEDFNDALARLDSIGWHVDRDEDGAVFIAREECEGWNSLAHYWQHVVHSKPLFLRTCIRQGLVPLMRRRALRNRIESIPSSPRAEGETP